MSLVDKVYRRSVAFDFFKKGWGRPELLLQLIKNLENVRTDPGYLNEHTTYRPIMIEKKIEYKKLIEMEGSFVSPFEDLVPGALCPNNRIARFQLVIPKRWKSKYKPLCFHFAGTGDHDYYRRRVFLANQLLEAGIGSVIIMNPFYGLRKPNDQRGSSLNYLSDLFVMGGSLVLECHNLLRWCSRLGFGPFALHGISMGGYMATICATTVAAPVSLIPCLSWTSASVVFVEGVLSNSVDWTTLTRQYIEDSAYSRVIRPRIQPSIKPIFQFKLEKQKEPIMMEERARELATLSSDSPRVDQQQVYQTTMSPTEAPPVGRPPIRNPMLTSQAPNSSSLSANTSNPLVLTINGLSYLNNLSKLWSYVKAHNKLHFYVDNYVLDGAMSVLRSVPSVLPVTSHFPPKPEPDPEVREFLREMLDFFTHLGNFPCVSDSRLITSVTAGRDAYVPRDGVVPFDVVFPCAHIRTLPQCGHVSAYVRNMIWSQDFHQAICDTLNRHMALHYGSLQPVFGKSVKATSTA
uniref:Uncharacterized protein C4orf29 homolog n=2 Tax=Schistocephalus solidus TaxID=70667 RepID=A0A0X3NIK4_SCHSO